MSILFSKQKCIIWCCYGDLVFQDILENEALKLDWTFKVSLMKDIFQVI